jgi:hypothetical protein
VDQTLNNFAKWSWGYLIGGQTIFPHGGFKKVRDLAKFDGKLHLYIIIELY